MKKTLVFLFLLTLVLGKDVLLSSEKNIGTCAKYTSDRESCLQCVSHYHLFEGQCYIDIHGCSLYVFGNICRKCQVGFILVNNECCDKHCMSRIFKNYEEASEQSDLTEEQKIERKITEGYEKIAESLSIFRYQFAKFVLLSTSNQVLQGYVRFFIKILANDKPYRCIADFQMDTKKVFILEFRLEAEMASIKEVILSQQDVVSNDEARSAIQYASGKFGLKTYGSSLERVSVNTYKYASEFKLIYLGTETAYIINVVVASGGSKKQTPYSPWNEERKDVQAIRSFVMKSMSVVKMRNIPDIQVIKQKISETSSIKVTEVEMKTIEKVKDNVYKYTFVNDKTKQVFEEISKVNPQTKTVEIVEHKEVINVDVKNMKLPESPEKRIIPKDQVTENPQVKETIKYLEEVQPSLATKQIVNAAVETIGENKKVTLIQKKNDQTTRVVVIHNERTNERKLVDESPVIATPPTETIYTTSPEGKPKIITTDVEKFKKNDEQVDKVITTIEKKFPSINTANIVSFEKTEGNLANTYQVVVKGDKPEQPKQQVTVVQDSQTKEVKIVDVEEIPTPSIIEPIKRKPTTLPETEYKSPEVKLIIQELKKTNTQFKDSEVVIKKVDIEEAKFANQYTVTVVTDKGEALTIKANKPHEEKQPEITSVKPIIKSTTTGQVTVETAVSYVSKVTVDGVSGVKTTTTTKPDDIQNSFVKQVLAQVTFTKTTPQVSQIQSLVVKQYEKTVTETAVIKEDKKFVQVIVEQNKATGTVTKISEQIIDVKVVESQPVLPVIATTKISQTTFTQSVKLNPVLKTVTQTVMDNKPIYKDQVPITTEVEQRGPVQVVTFVYENKKTQEKERIVAEYNTETHKTDIKEQATLPKVIQKVLFEKDITPQGDIKLISNNIDNIKKQDQYVTTVIQQVSDKFPIIKDNSVRFEVVSNPISNTYQITAVEPTTKETVTVSVSYNKQTTKVTVNDIQEQPKSETSIPKPIAMPVVVLTPEQQSQPEVKNVVSFVSKTVEIQQVQNVKETKNTLSTTYVVVAKTPEGTKSVTVVVDNSNPSDVTLIDVYSDAPVKPTPTSPQPSYTTVSTDSANVKDTTTNDRKILSSNTNLALVSQQAASIRTGLKNQVIICFSEDVFKSAVQISYLATVSTGTVLVSGIVSTTDSKVQILELPDESMSPSTYTSCAGRSSTITTWTPDTVTTLAKSDTEVNSLVSYLSSSFSVTSGSIQKVIVEKFTITIKYVILVTINKTTQRIVLIYWRRTTTFTVVESPQPIESTTPVVLEQQVNPDGSKTIISNSYVQVKTVDVKVQKFIQTLSKEVPVDVSQITSIVSKQGTNTNEYILTVKTQTTTNEIKAVYKKDDDSVIITQVKQEPQPLILPLVKPSYPLPKEEYNSPRVIKFVEQINNNPKLPDIKPKDILQIVQTTCPTTTSYQIVTNAPNGKQTFVISQNHQGDVTIIDYKPVEVPTTTTEPIKTEYTVNPVSGYETQVTNDVQVIQQSAPIQSVVNWLVEKKTVTHNIEVVSAVTKTLDTQVQTTIVIRNPEKPTVNTVVVAVFNKETKQVTVVNQKKVFVSDQNVQITPADEIIQTVYSTTVIQKTLPEDKNLQKIVSQVTQVNKDLQNVTPNQVIMEQIGDKVLATVTYEGKKVSTVVYDVKTSEAKLISTQPVPQNIVPLVYETQKSPDGTTVIMTNSPDRITDVTKNFPQVVSEIKQTIPTIQTEKIEGIKVTQSDVPNAPQKIVILFQSQKETQKTQVVVYVDPTSNKPIIADVQTIPQAEIIPTPEPVYPVKLTTKEIKEQNVAVVVTSNIQSLPFKEVKKVLDAQEVKTPYTTTLDIRVESTDGNKYVVRTQQVGNEQPTVVDYIKLTDAPKPQIFTVTTTNTKNGIISTYTNDVKVMSDEKTFTKCIDALEKQKALTKNGYVVDSQTISRLQRSIQHHVRFVNKDTNEGVDFRVIVDSRTGVISITEETPFTLGTDQSSTMPEEKQFMEIRKSEFAAAEAKYDYIKNGRSVLAKADYTFEGKIPELTQVKENKFSEGKSNVEVIFIFVDVVNGNTKKTRVVLLGQEKQTGKGYIMKIIDITTLPDVIPSTQTRISIDEYSRKTTSTNDVTTLQKNNQEYVSVIDQLREEVPSLNSAEVNLVVIRELKNVNEYTMMVKKGTEVIETKAVYDKIKQTTVITDFHTQSTKLQVERVPIKEIQSIVTEIPSDKLTAPEYVNLLLQIKSHPTVGQNVQIKGVLVEQNPKLDSYVIKIVDQHNIQSTVSAYKNPTTQQITVVSVVATPPENPQPTPTKQINTEIKIDSVTGSQIVSTNDISVIQQNPTIQNVVKKVILENTVSKSSTVVSAVTKTSTTKVQSTIVVQEPSKPNTQTVIVAISDRKEPTKIEIVTEQIIEITEEDQEETIEQIVEQVVQEIIITRNTYHTVIKKDTHLQNIVKTVQTKYKEIQDLTPIQIVMQQVGDQTLTEVTYDSKIIIVVTNEQQEVIQTYDEPVPENITPGTVETTITLEGTKTTVATSTVLMQQVEPQFTQVLVQIKQTDKTTIQTVVSEDTSFGTVYTIVTQKPEEPEPKQTIYYYSKDTKTVTSMGSEVIPVISVLEQSIPQPEPVKTIPEVKWTTGQVSTVITEVTNVVKQDKVTQVELLIAPNPTIKFYHVTVETPKGPEVIKVTVDQTTSQVTVIDQSPLTAQPTQPQPQGPSQTTIVVNDVTGVKTTTSTDTTVIQNDKYIKIVQDTIVKQSPELIDAQIVSLTTKDYTHKVEERVVYTTTTDSRPTQVITFVDKQTQVVTIVDQSTVDSTTPTTSSITLTTTTLQGVYDTDEILRRAIQFVGTKQPDLASSKPSNVHVEEFSATIEFTFVYTTSPSGSTPTAPIASAFRVLVLYTRASKTFELIQSPSPVQDVKPVVFQTTSTDQGRTDYFTNDIVTLQTYDTNFDSMFTLLTKDLQLNPSDISSVQSTQTSTGNSYTIIIVGDNNEQDQVNVLYNEDTNSIKVTDISTIVQTIVQPTVRPSVVVTKQEYTSSDITLVLSQSTDQLSINYTPDQITSIVKTKTTFGTTYVLNIQTPDGNAVLNTLLTPDQQVQVISYSAPTPHVVPVISEPSSVTQFVVDGVTGTQIQTTNDIKVISSSSTTQIVVASLIKTSTIPADSTVVSTVTKTLPDTIQTTLVVETSQQSKVIVAVTDRKTNIVSVIAEKPLTQQETSQPDISILIPQTIISSTTYEQVVKRDTVIQTVIQEIRDNHPEIKEPIPTKIVVEKVGDTTITDVSYQHASYTVTTNVKTGQTEEVSTTTLPKVEDRKPVVLQQTVTEQGTKIVISNKIEVIEKVVPTVRPAITEVTKVISFKPEDIKTIQTSLDDNQYTVVVVDQSSQVKQIRFTYQPENSKPITLIDVQQFSEVVTPVKPKEIVYEPVVISEQPKIIKTIETLNKTNTIIKNDVTEVIKVERAVTNFVEQYRVEVKTKNTNNVEEVATIILDTSSSDQPTVIDVIRYVPQQQQPQVVVVQETIDSVTQTRQTVFPNVETFKQDNAYPTVTQYLQPQITMGYQIVSVVKQNYGENNEITVLLKSDDRSPQQIQLNINGFNNEITVLENRTIVPQQTQESALLDKDKPATMELTLNPVDQEKFEIISKLNILKDGDSDFKALPDIKTLEKNDLFKKADAYLKIQFESILQQSNIVYVSTKQSLDSEEYKVYYINTKNNDKELYEAKVELNPITQTFEVQNFTKIASNQPEKSNLNIGSDIAYGYEPLDSFSNDKNLQFVVDSAKKHFTTLANAVIQSVEVLSLCNNRFNYKIFFKNGLLVEKYIIYYEQSFQRVIFLAGKQFSFGGTNYETLSKDQLAAEGYFKNVNQYLKEKNTEIAEESEIVLVERQDQGALYGYRAIYSKAGKTYHASANIDKDLLTINIDYFNQIIEIPLNQGANAFIAAGADSSTTFSPDQNTVLKINDLAHNSNFEQVHREILSQEGSFLQNAQLVGAIQSSQMFSIKYKFYFMINRQNYKVEAEIDSTTKKVTISSELEKVNLDSGFAIQNSGSDQASEIISWVQNSNPDLKAGVILQLSSKYEIFGQIYKVVFKLQTKFYTVVVYKEGDQLKILSQTQSITLDDSTPTVRSFPRPNRSIEVVLNKQ